MSDERDHLSLVTGKRCTCNDDVQPLNSRIEHDRRFPEPEKVPAPSPEYQRGWRAGYAQRMAEENSDLLMNRDHRRLVADYEWRGEEKTIRNADIITIPVGDLAYKLDDATDVDESTFTGYPRQSVPVAAGAENWDPNTAAASERPEAPSLNRCWKRLDAQRELINLLKDDTKAINERLFETQGEVERMDERIDNQRDWAVQRENAIRDRLSGDVHAINERFNLIENVLKSLPGVREIEPGKWVVESKPR